MFMAPLCKGAVPSRRQNLHFKLKELNTSEAATGSGNTEKY